MQTRVHYHLADGIATIKLDDGKANALSPDMLAAISDAFDRAAADRAAVLLVGREGRFSAGFDLGVLGGGGQPAAAMLMQGFELAAKIFAFPAPVVVACTGHALAMGAFLLLSADVRFGAAGPFKLGANEVAIGLTMPYFAVELCRARLATPYFQRSVITAEIYAPEDAAHAGFLDRVVAPTELLAAAQQRVTELAKLSREVYAATKLRARGQALAAIQAGIEQDRAQFAQWT